MQFHLLRLGYVAVFVLVGYRSWAGIITHQGDWEPFTAAAVSMWASSSLLSAIGIFRPLEMLPLVLFEVGYKLIWLGTVAVPLWLSGRLTGSAAEGMTYDFLAVAIPVVLIPWGYVFRRYVWNRPRRTGASMGTPATVSTGPP